jgi:hypothetical protein
VYPDRPTEAKIPKKDKRQETQEDNKSNVNRKIENEDAEAYKAEAKKANENIGDKHRTIEKAWLRFIFKAADRAFLMHRKRPGQFHRSFKHLPLTAPGAGHTENTTNLTHVAKIHHLF